MKKGKFNFDFEKDNLNNEFYYILSRSYEEFKKTKII
tara:strand:- start:469 stop:579 length:111 start_codon:yes stop_codon:yes gene_type:complete